MKRIIVHIGMPHCGTDRIQGVLSENRKSLLKQGVLFPRSIGRKNHTRLFMACLDDAHIDPLRWHRGHATIAALKRLRAAVKEDLEREVAQSKAHTLILSANQFGARLSTDSELKRLAKYLTDIGGEISILAHVDAQARVLTHHYASQVFEGRIADLTAEFELAGTGDWRGGALERADEIDPAINALPEIQSPPFWLDYEALKNHWATIFGKDSVHIRSYDEKRFYSKDISDEITTAFGLERPLQSAEVTQRPIDPSAETLSRARRLNELFQIALHSDRLIPRKLWRRMLSHVVIPGAPISPGSLAKISKYFEKLNAPLIKENKDLAQALEPPKAEADWAEAEPTNGFRASQYFTALLPRIDAATLEERKNKADALIVSTGQDAGASRLPANVQERLQSLQGTRFAPHNDIGTIDEETRDEPYERIVPRKLAGNSSGNVIVGCMKNEAPYILEWVAYHRAIGFDNFLIYTNGCTDQTDDILGRLQELGIVQHRSNEKWRGNSPQQFALNQSLKEKLIKNAEWIAHIDVDEFINVRVGNGTIQDFWQKVPDATNVAMTWRLFGNNKVGPITDAPIIEQFDACAPSYCPKPHTVWGFKTMFKNIGAYEKISCHRPNKLRDKFSNNVRWVNGSGKPMKESYKEKGWRSDVKAIGYDLIQLNHYALRSAESFLIKRQRGRALHVDRSIGLNYWIRMDWSDHKDITIQRNLPRLKAEMADILQDKKLAELQKDALAWHRAKAAELRENPEFAELEKQAQSIKLNPSERVAYAMALDLES